MKNILCYIFILSSALSCSSKKDSSLGINLDDIDNTPIEQVATAEEINLETSSLLKSSDLNVTASSMFEDSEKYALNSTVVASDAQLEDIVVDNSDLENIVESTEIDKNIPETVEYIVQENETLMLIAQKLYGDYTKWKGIRRVNGELLTLTNIKSGAKILVPTPDRNAVNSHNGTPYVLDMGDTLGKVSVHAYQSPKHWKYIWNNNKHSIKDPNLIFAGFTVYYLPLEAEAKRDMASEDDGI